MFLSIDLIIYMNEHRHYLVAQGLLIFGEENILLRKIITIFTNVNTNVKEMLPVTDMHL